MVIINDNIKFVKICEPGKLPVKLHIGKDESVDDFYDRVADATVDLGDEFTVTIRTKI